MTIINFEEWRKEYHLAPLERCYELAMELLDKWPHQVSFNEDDFGSGGPDTDGDEDSKDELFNEEPFENGSSDPGRGLLDTFFELT